MENQTKLYPSYMGEFYAANPVKFEKRRTMLADALLGIGCSRCYYCYFSWFYPCSGLVGSDGRSNCCINMSACSVFEQFRLL